MKYIIEKTEVYKVGEQVFSTHEEAKKHIVSLKYDKILECVDFGGTTKTSELLREIINQGLTNRNKLLNVVEYLELHGY